MVAVEFGHPNRTVRLMGNTWPAVEASVELSLEPFPESHWSAEVLFVAEEGLPFALLGYEGFLNRWSVSFNGCLGYFIVEPVEDFHARQPRDVMEILRAKWPHLLRGW
jgi:hypothetical protein